MRRDFKELEANPEDIPVEPKDELTLKVLDERLTVIELKIEETQTKQTALQLP